MTITGQINGTYSGYANRYAVRLYYSYDQNQLDNYSTVSAYLQIRSINSPQYGAYSNLGSASIAFGGYTASASNITFDFRDYDWHTVISMTNKRVNHNTDGTKDLYFSASFATNDSDISSIITASASGTVPLQSILRASTFGALTDFYIESPFGFAINKYIEDAVDTLTIEFNTFSKVVTDYTSGEDIEFTLAELNSLYALTTAQNSIPFTLTITTGAYGSNTATVNGYITVTNPTFSGTITPTPNYAINGQTSVSVALSTGAVAYKDATISEYIVSIGTQTLRSNTYANPFVFSNVDGNTITVNVVDSRGNSLASPQTQSITLHPYAKPTIVPNIQRTPTMADDTVSFAVSGVFSVVPNQVNPTVSYRYRESGSTWGASTTVTATYGTGTYSYTATLVATFDVDKSYEFEITVTDAYTTTVMSVTLFSAQPTMDIDTATQRVAIGKFLDSEADKSLSIAGNLYINGIPFIEYLYPVGSIYMSANSTDPSTIFGGTWTRIKDRFLLSAGDDYTAGDTGGEATHVLTTQEMPSHTHSQTVTYSSQSPTVNWALTWSGNNYNGNWQSTGSAGENKAHNNMPPYLVVYCWQRTA